jgi:hypothetical protein
MCHYQAYFRSLPSLYHSWNQPLTPLCGCYGIVARGRICSLINSALRISRSALIQMRDINYLRKLNRYCTVISALLARQPGNVSIQPPSGERTNPGAPTDAPANWPTHLTFRLPNHSTFQPSTAAYPIAGKASFQIPVPSQSYRRSSASICACKPYGCQRTRPSPASAGTTKTPDPNPPPPQSQLAHYPPSRNLKNSAILRTSAAQEPKACATREMPSANPLSTGKSSYLFLRPEPACLFGERRSEKSITFACNVRPFIESSCA